MGGRNQPVRLWVHGNAVAVTWGPHRSEHRACAGVDPHHSGWSVHVQVAIGMVRQSTRKCGRDGAAHRLWMDDRAVHGRGVGRIEAEKADRRVTELGPDASIGCKGNAAQIDP